MLTLFLTGADWTLLMTMSFSSGAEAELPSGVSPSILTFAIPLDAVATLSVRVIKDGWRCAGLGKEKTINNNRWKDNKDVLGVQGFSKTGTRFAPYLSLFLYFPCAERILPPFLVTSVPISELWTPISKGKGKNSKKWCYIQLIMTTKIVFMCTNAERFRVEMTCHSRKKEKKRSKKS